MKRLALVLLLVAGCAPEEARVPNPTRPLDERRAVEVIRRAVKAYGVEPTDGREERIPGYSQKLHIDVGIAGKHYGVAFVTSDDAQALGEAIPPANKRDERLRLVAAGNDGKTHVLLLYQQNYLYDDFAGETHEKTVITCEGALGLDVRDFMIYARHKGFE